jgi:dipeptidyl aminopeptidase/acylaminoacyl peptidase
MELFSQILKKHTMRIYSFFTAFFLVFACYQADAQKMLTLDDVTSGGSTFRNFIPQFKNVSFRKGSDEVILIENDTVWNVGVKKGGKSFLFGVHDINQAINQSLKRLPAFQWIDYERIAFRVRNDYFIVNPFLRKMEGTISLPEDAEVPDFIPEMGVVAFARGKALFIAGTDFIAREVASETNEGVSFGRTVHRNEFGIKKGTFWSPSGAFLAFYRMDEGMVTDYPLVNTDTRIAEKNLIKYPMAGMSSHEVTVGVYNTVTRSTVYLKTQGAADDYLTNVCWSPDSKFVFVAELNRGQNHMKLNQFDAFTGEFITTLFEEKDEQWVEPQEPMLFVPGQNDLYIWESFRDGYNHLYLYSLKNGFVRQLTKGNFDVNGIVGFDERGQNIFFTSAYPSPLDVSAFKVQFSTGKLTRITRTDGVHSLTMGKSGKVLVDHYASKEVPRVIQVINDKGETLQSILKAADPYSDVKLGEVKLVKLMADDGKTELYGRLVLPANFDSTQRYPVVVYVYGGPHTQLVQNRFKLSAMPWQLFMAQKGYVCFTLDNRGTPSRGREFEQVIHRRLGEKEMADQMKGIEYLKGLPFVDETRIGVHGWSYGGFMTISLMTTFPQSFKVGVAGGPVIDWKFYEIMYGERYMDSPQENPEGYAANCLNDKAKNLKGRLLVIHGAMDDVVVMQHSLTFLNACIAAKVPVDYFVYPRHQHNVSGPDRVHLMQKVTQYFDDFLK